MARVEIGPQALVSAVLEHWPQTIPVFLEHGMACVGCPMAAFETLEEAAAIYGLDPARLIEEMRCAGTGAPSQA